MSDSKDLLEILQSALTNSQNYIRVDLDSAALQTVRTMLKVSVLASLGTELDIAAQGGPTYNKKECLMYIDKYISGWHTLDSVLFNAFQESLRSDSADCKVLLLSAEISFLINTIEQSPSYVEIANSNLANGISDGTEMEIAENTDKYRTIALAALKKALENADTQTTSTPKPAEPATKEDKEGEVKINTIGPKGYLC